MGTSSVLRQIYFKSTGYSFTNMGRLFLRLFIGIMLSQFGVRQLAGDCMAGLSGPFDIPFVACGLATWLVIVVEIICSFFIMIGLFTRILLIPPFVLMVSACHHIATTHLPGSPETVQLLSVPFLFMGIYMFLFLVGPGKISIDYFFSLYLINRHHDKDKEEDLEEV